MDALAFEFIEELSKIRKSSRDRIRKGSGGRTNISVSNGRMHEKLTELYKLKNGKMDKEGLKMAFDILDSDGNGIITHKELKDIFKVFHLKENEENIDRMIKEADTKGKGGITFPQFQHIMGQCSHKIDTSMKLRKIFQRIDRDKSGTINVEELKDYIRKIGQVVSQQEVEEMIKVADEDGDGEVSFEEFLKMVS